MTDVELGNLLQATPERIVAWRQSGKLIEVLAEDLKDFQARTLQAEQRYAKAMRELMELRKKAASIG